MDTERAGPLAYPPGHPGTGDARVDEAVAGLAVLGEMPLDQHPPVLEAVHDRLREILGELGEAGARQDGQQWRQGHLGR